MTAVTSSGGLTSFTGRQWLVLLMVQLSTLLFGMTITLANVVLPQVRGALSATQDQIAWAVTFNLVATAVATPMTGWLADRFGWRLLMFGSVAGFTTFSLLCGLAGSLETLVLYRVGQGLCGAPIHPMGQAILLATFPRHLHPQVMMMWGFGAVIGPVSGPILGSMISEVYDWRWAFFMIVPPGVAASVCIWLVLAGQTERTQSRFDWTGFLALSTAIACAQLIMDRGQRLDWFDSMEIRIEATLVVIGLWVFVVHSLTSPHPFLSPALLKDRNFSIGLIVSFVMGMLSFTPLVLFPGLLHDLRGYPDHLIGLLLSARGIGNWLSFLIVVPMTKHYPRASVAIGLTLQAVSGWSMAQIDINVSSFDVFWMNVLQGFGFGLAFTPMSVLTFATLPVKQITEGSAVFSLLRNFGSSIFISICIVLLVRSTATNYATLSEQVTAFNRALAYPGVIGSWSLETTRGLAAIAGEIQRQAAMIGYINAFYLFAFTAAAAIPLACLMRNAPRPS